MDENAYSGRIRRQFCVAGRTGRHASEALSRYLTELRRRWRRRARAGCDGWRARWNGFLLSNCLCQIRANVDYRFRKRDCPFDAGLGPDSQQSETRAAASAKSDTDAERKTLAKTFGVRRQSAAATALWIAISSSRSDSAVHNPHRR